MNCKPGELAIIVATDIQEERADLGKIVRIIAAGDEYWCIGDSRHHWRCDTLGQRITTRCLDYFSNTIWLKLSDGVETLDFADANMRPIRDPGDDAVDEMVQLITAKPPEAVPA